MNEFLANNVFRVVLKKSHNSLLKKIHPDFFACEPAFAVLNQSALVHVNEICKIYSHLLEGGFTSAAKSLSSRYPVDSIILNLALRDEGIPYQIVHRFYFPKKFKDPKGIANDEFFQSITLSVLELFARCDTLPVTELEAKFLLDCIGKWESNHQAVQAKKVNCETKISSESLRRNFHNSFHFYLRRSVSRVSGIDSECVAKQFSKEESEAITKALNLKVRISDDLHDCPSEGELGHMRLLNWLSSVPNQTMIKGIVNSICICKRFSSEEDNLPKGALFIPYNCSMQELSAFFAAYSEDQLIN